MNLKEYEYEFNKDQTEVIYSLSKAMRFVALFLYVLGWLTILGGFLTVWLDQSYHKIFSAIIPGVITILIAIWTNKAVNYFKKIVQDEGNDIKSLMLAFAEIRNIYRFKFWVFALAPLYWILIIIGSLLGFL
ncbi:MAG TPA: hypothetical protein DD379_15460 [Cyanobacteria bacterium UBA11162]|nr:hypothetical protein [Cyanobacteria bacterium UBA11162]